MDVKKIHINFQNNIIIIKEKLDLLHIIIFIISSIIISSHSMMDNHELDESKYSYIILKIGKGNNEVYSNYYYKDPNIIYINENKQKTIKRDYNFEESENSVILIWEKPITNCQYMFNSCNKIIYMDLTHFNTSQVTDMFCMFEGCNNLKYLNVSNINASKVKNMGNMFKYCSSLILLDLFSFNTSSFSNIDTMLMGCSS